MEASEWAQRKVESIQAAREAEATRDALNLERQRIRTANFPDLAQGVAEAFRSYCEEYNKRRLSGDKRIDFHAISGAINLLKRDAGLSEMQMQVNHLAGYIRVTAVNCDFHYDRIYRPEAIADGSAMLSCSPGRGLTTPDGVARDAMDAFLAGRDIAERL